MEYDERKMIKINDNGVEKEIEVIAIVPSKIDDKKYAVYTFDKEIGDEVNIDIAVLRSKDNISYLETIENEDELDYAYFLMNEIINEG